MPFKIRVESAGQALTVDVEDPAGDSVTVYRTDALADTWTLPKDIVESTNFFLPDTLYGLPYEVTVTQADGTVLYQSTVLVDKNKPLVIGPVPSNAQLASLVSWHSDPILVSITVEGDDDTVEEAATEQYAATGTYHNGTTADLTATVTWASDDTDIATIDSAGEATGVLAGTCNITATLGDVVSDPVELEVTAP